MKLEECVFHKFLQWLRGHGIDLSDKEILRLQLFVCELLEWNQKINLVGLKDGEAIIRELVLDSLLPCVHLPDTGNLLDIGSGAGFPAIPIKICKPALQMTLLEPRQKRISFLKQVIRVVKLERIDTVRKRIEDFFLDTFPGYYPPYDIVTMRAVGKLGAMVEMTLPLLRKGGKIILFAGESVPAIRELINGPWSNEITFHKKVKYLLPGKITQRNLLILKKEL